MNKITRICVAGMAGGLVFNLAMLVTFRLIGFGWNGNGILLTSPIQSKKLIAVWTEIKPLPLVVYNPAPIIAGIMVFGLIHAFLYHWLSSSWPAGIVRRALRFAGLVFLLQFLFWEFFTPFNQFGEPLVLVGLELVFWAVIALAEAFAIAYVLENRTGMKESNGESI